MGTNVVNIKCYSGSLWSMPSPCKDCAALPRSRPASRRPWTTVPSTLQPASDLLPMRKNLSLPYFS